MKYRISIPFPVQTIFYKPSRGVDRKLIEFFKYHGNFIYCAHMWGENISYNKVKDKNEQFIVVYYSNKDSGDLDIIDDSDDHAPPSKPKNTVKKYKKSKVSPYWGFQSSTMVGMHIYEIKI